MAGAPPDNWLATSQFLLLDCEQVVFARTVLILSGLQAICRHLIIEGPRPYVVCLFACRANWYFHVYLLALPLFVPGSIIRNGLAAAVNSSDVWARFVFVSMVDIFNVSYYFYRFFA